MRAAVYTRVSSEEQLDGYSLEAQADVVQRLCEFREWQIVARYEERGRSGRSVFRPQFQTMIADAEEGKFDVIVVHKLDRFSRSLLDVLTYLNRLNKANVAFVSATEDFDFSTPFGKLILAVLGAFAQWYVDNLAAEVRKGKKQRAKSGGWNGWLSFGYTTPARIRRDLVQLGEDYTAQKIELDEYERKTGLLEQALERYGSLPETFAVPCPFNAPGVVLAYTLRATGRYTYQQIAWELNKAGYRTAVSHILFSGPTVRKMLKSSFYLGKTSYRGECLEGSHEALISRELYEQVRRVDEQRAHAMGNTSPSRGVRTYPLSGLLRCSQCGDKYKGQTRGTNRYYRDTSLENGHDCQQYPRSAQADRVEKQVDSFLQELKLELPDDWQNRVLMMLEDVAPNEEEQREALMRTLEHKLERAKALFLEGDIAKAEYERIRAEVQQQMPDLPPTKRDIIASVEDVAAVLKDFGTLLLAATVEERKALYRSLFRSLYVENGRIVAAEPTGVLWTLMNCAIMQETSQNSPKITRTRRDWTRLGGRRGRAR